jgi:hypothetical protein
LTLGARRRLRSVAARPRSPALEGFKSGHITKPELRRLLDFATRILATRYELDGFLKAHEVSSPMTNPIRRLVEIGRRRLTRFVRASVRCKRFEITRTLGLLTRAAQRGSSARIFTTVKNCSTNF